MFKRLRQALARRKVIAAADDAAFAVIVLQLEVEAADRRIARLQARRLTLMAALDAERLRYLGAAARLR